MVSCTRRLSRRRSAGNGPVLRAWLPILDDDGKKSDMPKVRVIGVPLDLGQERRGVDMGPSAIRVAGLNDPSARELGLTVEDAGNLTVPMRESPTCG